MGKLRSYTFCLIFFVLSCSSEQEIKTGLLWKITSTDGKESFLYGTMHLYPPDRVQVSSNVFSLLKDCKTLALERNIRDVEDQRLFLQNNKHKINSKADKILAGKYESFRSMEGELMRVADSCNIRITGLETAAELQHLQNKIPAQKEESQEELILRQEEQTITIYESEQIGYLADSVLDKELGYEVRRLMVDQRNVNWLDDIEKLIRQDKTFIAVGMGHLGGDKGLLRLLKQKGYKVERVRLQEQANN